MKQNLSGILSKGFLILILFSLTTSSIVPYYLLEKIGIEFLCDSKDKDTEEKEEKKEKIRNDIDDSEFSFSKKFLKYHNFKNFHHTHFREIETPPPESLV